VLDMVYTRVEVHRMDSEMSGLVERPWLQLICCAVVATTRLSRSNDLTNK